MNVFADPKDTVPKKYVATGKMCVVGSVSRRDDVNHPQQVVITHMGFSEFRGTAIWLSLFFHESWPVGTRRGEERRREEKRGVYNPLLLRPLFSLHDSPLYTSDTKMRASSCMASKKSIKVREWLCWSLFKTFEGDFMGFGLLFPSSGLKTDQTPSHGVGRKAA